jgi:hypothetical protein
MERCQVVHDLRKCRVEVGSPQTQTQRDQVTRVVNYLIKSYREVQAPIRTNDRVSSPNNGSNGRKLSIKSSPNGSSTSSTAMPAITNPNTNTNTTTNPPRENNAIHPLDAQSGSSKGSFSRGVLMKEFSRALSTSGATTEASDLSSIKDEGTYLTDSLDQSTESTSGSLPKRGISRQSTESMKKLLEVTVPSNNSVNDTKGDENEDTQAAPTALRGRLGAIRTSSMNKSLSTWKECRSHDEHEMPSSEDDASRTSNHNLPVNSLGGTLFTSRQSSGTDHYLTPINKEPSNTFDMEIVDTYDLGVTIPAEGINVIESTIRTDHVEPIAVIATATPSTAASLTINLSSVNLKNDMNEGYDTEVRPPSESSSRKRTTDMTVKSTIAEARQFLQDGDTNTSSNSDLLLRKNSSNTFQVNIITGNTNNSSVEGDQKKRIVPIPPNMPANKSGRGQGVAQSSGRRIESTLQR